LAFTNTGNNTQTALWRVFLDSDTRNNYNMTVSVN
jgi:hypothetical protein